MSFFININFGRRRSANENSSSLNLDEKRPENGWWFLVKVSMRRDVRHKICYSKLRICKAKHIDRDVTKKLMFGTYIRFKGKKDLTNKFHTVYNDWNITSLAYHIILKLFTLKGSKSRSIKYIQPVRLQEAWVWDAGMLSVRRLLWKRLRRK